VSRFTEGLNDQIANEFAASQQYVAIAVHYDAITLPRMAAFFYAQAVEERNHAMMIVQYLLDTDSQVRVPGLDAPKTDFADTVEPVSIALEQERAVGEEISGLAAVAREERDYQSEQFMRWFLKEQVEEVATMSTLLDVVERTRDRPDLAEQYLAREPRVEENDPTAPPAAGGAL
jgi:Ferritin-like protein